MTMQKELMKKILQELDPDGSKLKAALQKFNVHKTGYSAFQDIAFKAALEMAEKFQFASIFKNTWKFECFKPDGTLRWEEVTDNIFMNTGLTDILEQYWNGSAYNAQHYLGLTDATPVPVATDTLLTATWTEIHTQYNEATRSDLTAEWNAAASQSIDNSGTPSVFTINATVTIGGGFIAGSATKNETASTLYAAAAFDSNDRAAQNGDTLNVTVTSTAANP